MSKKKEAELTQTYEVVYFDRPGPLGTRLLWKGFCTEKQAIKNWKYYLKEHKNAELLLVTTQRKKIKP